MLMQVASCRNRLAEPRGSSDNLLRQQTPALPVPLARPAGLGARRRENTRVKKPPVHVGRLKPDGINKDLAKRARKAAALPAPRFKTEVDTSSACGGAFGQARLRQTLIQPLDVGPQRRKAVLDGLIVQMSKSFVTSPVHSLRPCWKVIEHSETASKYFSNLLSFEDEPVTRSRLPSGIGQPIAVPTAPEVAARSIELSDPSTTVAQKVSAPSAEVPRHPSDWEYLIVERDSIVVPVPRVNASRVKFISVNPPISRNVADVARSG